MKRADLIQAVEIIAEGAPSDAELVARLVRMGFELGPAHRLVAFVPTAFARPVLERLGVTDFSEQISVPTRNGGFIEIRLRDQPEYLDALALARDHWKHGVLKRETYEAITFGSAEIDAVSNALNQGVEVEGAAIATALISTIHADHVIQTGPGWFNRFRRWLG